MVVFCGRVVDPPDPDVVFGGRVVDPPVPVVVFGGRTVDPPGPVVVCGIISFTPNPLQGSHTPLRFFLYQVCRRELPSYAHDDVFL